MQVRERAVVGQVAVVQKKPDAGSRAGRGRCGRCAAVLKVDDATDEAVDLVALREQQLRQVRAVLPGDSGDQRFLHDEEVRVLAQPAALSLSLTASQLRVFHQASM